MENIKCTKCNDTGVIETGNNDLPCDCPAGDEALFNEMGVIGPVTVSSVAPEWDGMKNGSMLDPLPEGDQAPYQGFDSRAAGYAA
ncbi:MAG: hypothetical protein AAB740_04785, partial [Patescibacteria group bacterium]